MKIILTGSLGHIGKPLTKELVQKRHAVTVISSEPDKQKSIEALGATAAIGKMEDADFLTATFTSADTLYCMIPPTNFFSPTYDVMVTYPKIGNSYAQAIQQSNIKRVVH